ncbi:hypothetical protein ACF0H5_013631 [Mactra antiquata]
MKNNGILNFRARKTLNLTESESKKHSTLQSDESLPLLVVKGISKNTDKTKGIKQTNSNYLDDIREVNEVNKVTKVTKQTSKVVNLPILHQSNNLDVREGTCDSTTIKKSRCDETLSDHFLNIFSLTGVMDDNDSSNKSGSHFENKNDTSNDENCSSLISKYPPIEEDEIEKHRHLNEEAEKNNSSKAPTINKQNYLERLKLKNQAIADQKARELKLQKRKIAKRSQPKQYGYAKDPNEFFMEQEPLPPPKPKSVEAKPIKLILGFKYSYAIEQYYRGQMKQFGSNLTFLNDLDTDKEDVLNGWIVKTLGPAVLNMKARTLPSCNPIELRMRTRMHRTRKLRNSHRSWSRDSTEIATMSRSQDSFSRLNKIEEERIQGHASISPRIRKVSMAEKLDVIDDNDDRLEERDRHTELPVIKSCEKMFITAPKIKKEISLKLPAIGVDD